MMHSFDFTMTKPATAAVCVSSPLSSPQVRCSFYFADTIIRPPPPTVCTLRLPSLSTMVLLIVMTFGLVVVSGLLTGMATAAAVETSARWFFPTEGPVM